MACDFKTSNFHRGATGLTETGPRLELETSDQGEAGGPEAWS